jgi:hypothetical protein
VAEAVSAQTIEEGRDSLARAYHFASQTAPVIAFQKESLEFARQKASPDPHHTLMFTSQSAEMYSTQKQLRAAIALQEKVLKIARPKLGPNNSDNSSIMNGLTGECLDVER